MKKLKVFLYVVIISIGIMFSTNSISEELTLGDCQFLSVLGAKIMEARQLGVPMELTLDAIENKSIEYKELVEVAYSYPEYTLEVYKKQAIEDFKEEIIRECVKIVIKD